MKSKRKVYKCKWLYSDGNYEGEVKQTKGKSVPHGYGRWAENNPDINS